MAFGTDDQIENVTRTLAAQALVVLIDSMATPNPFVMYEERLLHEDRLRAIAEYADSTGESGETFAAVARLFADLAEKLDLINFNLEIAEMTP